MYLITHSSCVQLRPDGYITCKETGILKEVLSQPEHCRENLAGVLRRIMFLEDPAPLARVAIVNGVKDLNLNAEKPTVNGVY